MLKIEDILREDFDWENVEIDENESWHMISLTERLFSALHLLMLPLIILKKRSQKK